MLAKDDLLTPEQTAEILLMTTGSLSQLRYRGGGPAFVKIGQRVRYRRSDLDDYLSGRTYRRTDARSKRAAS